MLTRLTNKLVRYGEEELIQWEQAQPSGGDDPQSESQRSLGDMAF
jgi:hypothetical protein